MGINQIHQYELSLLSWAVEQPINGGTDWNTLAAFVNEQDAQDYAHMLNEQDGDNTCVVSHVGTLHRAGV